MKNSHLSFLVLSLSNYPGVSFYFMHTGRHMISYILKKSGANVKHCGGAFAVVPVRREFPRMRVHNYAHTVHDVTCDM